VGVHGVYRFYQIQADFKAKVESEFNKMIDSVTIRPAAVNE
jgi:hypothetical protein